MTKLLMLPPRRIDPLWRAKHYIEMRTGRIPDPEKERRDIRLLQRRCTAMPVARQPSKVKRHVAGSGAADNEAHTGFAHRG